MTEVDAGGLPIFRAYPTNHEERFIREFILQLKLGHTSRGYFRKKYGEDAKLVFIGPCLAKKAESSEIDAALTFREIREMMETERINISKIEPAAGLRMVEKQDKTSETNKKLHAPTANNNGNAQSTIMPMLTEADYIQQVAPQYPPRAIELGMEGVVIVKALIGAAGTAKDVEILDSSGYNLLDNSALKAVSKWTFKTANLNLNREMWVQVPVKFIIR
jgi:TonB family protein